MNITCHPAHRVESKTSLLSLSTKNHLLTRSHFCERHRDLQRVHNLLEVVCRPRGRSPERPLGLRLHKPNLSGKCQQARSSLTPTPMTCISARSFLTCMPKSTSRSPHLRDKQRRHPSKSSTLCCWGPMLGISSHALDKQPTPALQVASASGHEMSVATGSATNSFKRDCTTRMRAKPFCRFTWRLAKLCF